MNEFKSPLKASGISSLIFAIIFFVLYLYVSSEPYYSVRWLGLNRSEIETLLIIAIIVFVIMSIVEFSVYAALKSEYERNQKMNMQNQFGNQYPNQYQNNPQYRNQQPYAQNTTPQRMLYVECQNCHQMNNANNKFCNYCNYSLEIVEQPPRVEQPPVDDPNTWRCKNCGVVNQNYVGTCGCGEVKPR